MRVGINRKNFHNSKSKKWSRLLRSGSRFETRSIERTIGKEMANSFPQIDFSSPPESLLHLARIHHKRRFGRVFYFSNHLRCRCSRFFPDRGHQMPDACASSRSDIENTRPLSQCQRRQASRYVTNVDEIPDRVQVSHCNSARFVQLSQDAGEHVRLRHPNAINVGDSSDDPPRFQRDLLGFPLHPGICTFRKHWLGFTAE